MRTMRQIGKHMTWLVGGIFLLAAAPALAAEPTNAELKAELETLKIKMGQMESKLQQVGGAAAYQPPETGGSVLHVPGGEGVQISGFVDTSYSYNFNEPQTRTNTLRVFDTRAGDFMINNAELVVEKPVSDASRGGFRVDLDFGTDPEVVGSVTTGLGANNHTHGQNGETAVSDELELQQMYGEYLAPIGKGLDIKLGRFVTMHGAEVIESKDNWNFTRSLLFGYAIPFTHTGLRATYPWADWLSTTVGVSNGWDVVDDNNQGKTVEVSATVVPFEHASLTTTYMIGAEQNADNGNPRNLLDIVASYQPMDPLQLKLNFDYGWEHDGTRLPNAGQEKNASWTGLAGYARYQLCEKAALALRAEWLHDADGIRTAFTSGLNGVTGTDLQILEYTVTGEYKLTDHLLTRLEYRHDQASEHIFRNDDVGQRAYQDTLSMEVIAPF